MPNQTIATTTEATTEPTKPTSKRYRCRHIFIDGHRCGSPSLRGQPFCYYHHTTLGFADDKRFRRTWTEFELPPLEDRSSVLAAINEVLQRIAGNQIAAKDAGLLLYGLQIASLNLPEPGEAKAQSDAQPKEQTVEEVIPIHPYGDLAPIAEFVEAANTTIAPEQQDAPRPSLEDAGESPFNSSQPSDPKPITLFNLNASVDFAPPRRVILSEVSRSLIARGAVEGPAVAVAVAGSSPSPNTRHLDRRPEAAAERPLYFAVAPATNPPLPTQPEINTANPAPAPSAWYPNNCHAYEKRTSRPPHSAHRHQAAQRRRSRRCHALHGLQLA
jgi:hypothetical protein